MRDPVDHKGGREPQTALAPQRSGKVESAALAARIAWAALESGEGGRVGVLGDSGVGKTVLEIFLLDYWLKHTTGPALVVDDKGPIQRFKGEPRKDVDDLRQRPIEDGTRTVVFRGDLVAGRDVNIEEVAQLAWRSATVRRRPTLLVIDEISKACRNGQWLRGTHFVEQAFSKGRENKVSVLWSGQMAQQFPGEAFDLSSSIACFKCTGNALDILRRRELLDGIDPSVISSLPGELSPKRERGKFVLLVKGRPWDGRFYRVQ